MSKEICESTVEEAVITWLENLGYAVKSGPDIASGKPQAKRKNYHETVLKQRLPGTLLPRFILGKIDIKTDSDEA